MYVPYIIKLLRRFNPHSRTESDMYVPYIIKLLRRFNPHSRTESDYH